MQRLWCSVRACRWWCWQEAQPWCSWKDLPALGRPAGQRRAGGREPASENSWRPRGPAVELATHLTPLTPPPPSDGSPGPNIALLGPRIRPGQIGVEQVAGGGGFSCRDSTLGPLRGGRPNATMHHSSPRACPATTCLLTHPLPKVSEGVSSPAHPSYPHLSPFLISPSPSQCLSP